jgi:molybdenum cofactor guanylyltransferase
MQKTTGIILAGGRSSRMGTNKALLKLSEKTVIEKISEELREVVSDILIVTNTFEDYQFLGLPMIEDQWKGMGPLAGIHAGLNSSNTEKNLITACDMPFISSELGNILLHLLDKYDVVVPKISGQIHPLFAAYRKDVHTEIEKSLQKQELRMSAFLKRMNTKIMSEEDLSEHNFSYLDQHFFNMNHPDEFEIARKLAADQSKEKRD